MIQLTDKLIAVLVPEDAYDVRVVGNNILGLCSNLDNNPSGYFQIRTGSHLLVNIIGTITKERVFDFDPSAHIESQTYQYTGDKEKEKAVEMNGLHGLVFNKKMSAIVLLNSKGIFLDKLEGQKVLLIEKI